MISRIEGRIVSVGDGVVELQCGPLTYALLVPATDMRRLGGEVGRSVEFHTLCYLESQAQGASFQPRLIGFESADARSFFELLTTVKGLGARRALRTLTIPHQTIAGAIAGKDVDLLTTLPEIGRRTAETIVAELHGKVDSFMEVKPGAGSASAMSHQTGMIHDAMAALTQLGEPRARARQLLDRALADDPTLDSADALVAAVYRQESFES